MHAVNGINISLSPVPFKRNRVRYVRCVNENRKKRKRLRWGRWQAANYGCHCFDRAFLLAGACVCCVAACQRKRLRFLRFSFTQRTQRTRLRLNGTGFYAAANQTDSTILPTPTNIVGVDNY